MLLGAVPLLTNARSAALRDHADVITGPALVIVNDLQASLATESVALGELVRAGEGPLSQKDLDVAATVRSTRDSAAADQQKLDSLVRLTSSDAVLRFGEAREAIAAWQRDADAFVADVRAGRTGASGDGRGRLEALQTALTSTRRLEEELTERAREERKQIQRMETLTTTVPMALVPVALLALAAVLATAQRTLTLARAAHEGRASAERAMAAKSALLRGVTHDLKNPLGAAAGYADLLGDGIVGPMPEAQAQVVQRLRRLLAVTLDTVSDLLDLSRAEAGDLRVDRVATDVSGVVREAVDDYRASAAAAGVALSLDAAGPGVHDEVDTDPSRVRQVLGNVLSNALKYTPRGGAVRVRVAAVRDAALGPTLVVEVADTGPGVPPALRERVFEEFFRVPSTSEAAPGTGVGLAIGRRVARLLGGDLRLGEGRGGGATFTLLLPTDGVAGDVAEAARDGASAA